LLSLQEVFEDFDIDAWNGNRHPKADENNHSERKENAIPQFGDFPSVRKC